LSAATHQWTLDALLSPWVKETVPSLSVSGVTSDSRQVESGDVYLALSGATTHGIAYASAAVQAGAVAVLVSDQLSAEYQIIVHELQEQKVPLVSVNSLDESGVLIASRFYHEPDKSLTVVAVTGTDGKTSVCRFIAQALTASGRSCGYIGTLGWGLGDVLQATALTTPDSVMLRRCLAAMRDQGASCVALEASSHGIAEGRLDGLALDVAVLTNLGRDHLDYHITLEAYHAAKEQLFHWQTLKAVVLNADDDMGRDLIGKINHIPCFAYSTSADSRSADSRPAATNPDYKTIAARDIAAHDAGLEFDIVDTGITRHLQTGLLGGFNVDNVLACYASLRACEIAANDAFHALAAVSAVPGRMERLGGSGKVTIVIDYSHTPGALSAAIDAVRVHCKHRLWVVFGCGGDRDPGKRAPMAQAAQAADHVVLTDDNPRTESSAAIIKDAMAGFDRPEHVHVIPDRSTAIQFAISNATSDDLVLIAGKGHENYQIVGNARHHFSDREQSLAALELAS